MGLIAIKDRKKHIIIDFVSLHINGGRIFKKGKEKSFDLSAGCFLICQSMKTINANGLESQSGSYRLSKISNNRKKSSLFFAGCGSLTSSVWRDASLTAPSLCGEFPPNDGGMLGVC